VEKIRYTNEIESVHSEIGDDLDHLVLCDELDLSNKQDFPINPKTNHTKSQTQRERERPLRQRRVIGGDQIGRPSLWVQMDLGFMLIQGPNGQ
jgi:hypothetical protein